MEKGDVIIPDECSPFIGGSMENHNFRVFEIIGKERMIVIRNDWHKFESLFCYFKKKVND